MSEIYPPEFDSERAPLDPMGDRHAVRATFWKRFTILIGVLAFIVCTLSTTVAVLLMRQTQNGNKPVLANAATAAEAAKAGTTRIEDCTTPGKDCFEDGQKRLAAQIATLIDSQQKTAAASAACAAQLAPQLVNLSQHEATVRVYTCQQAQLQTLAHKR